MISDRLKESQHEGVERAGGDPADIGAPDPRDVVRSEGYLQRLIDQHGPGEPTGPISSDEDPIKKYFNGFPNVGEEFEELKKADREAPEADPECG